MDTVEHILKKAQTVSQLRETLKGLNPDAHVLFVCDCHQIQQALPAERADEYFVGTLVESSHSKSGIAFLDLDDDEEIEDETIIVAITSSAGQLS